MHANQSVLDWRREQRSLWNLQLDPLPYATMESYAQPQKQDWPVYDPDQDIYVQWTPATSHMESMLDLSVAECKQLRCISIFIQRCVRETGKNRSAPVFNYKKLSITMARWEESLPQDRCTTARSRAACRWLYANNMTYRERYDMHRTILNDYRSNSASSRTSLYISTYELLMKSPGIEVAAWPILYPWSRYGDTDVRDRLCDGGSGTEKHHYSGKTSFIRKLLSRCRAYEQEPHLIFFLYDRFLCKSLFAKSTVADNRGVTADVTGASTVISDSYWRSEQDYTADVVRQMARRCREANEGDPIWQYQQSSSMFDDPDMDKSLAFPNLFITIAPAEWLFPQHCSAMGYYPTRGHDVAGFASLHMYSSIRDTILALLQETNSRWFRHVFHYLIRLEYQERGTLHFHIAVWAILKRSPSSYIGRTGGYGRKGKLGQRTTSEFHSYLESLFNKCHIDVQWTTGRLNYINGYTTKAHDSIDFRINDMTMANPGDNRWYTIYRLLCRHTVCIPQAVLWFNEAPPMIRSFRIHPCYPPLAWPDARKDNDTERLYCCYFEQTGLSRQPFLDYCRAFHFVNNKLTARRRLDVHLVAIGVRYCSEMRDNFVGQMAAMHMPHGTREHLQGCSDGSTQFDYVRCLIGWIDYLMSLAWNPDGTVRLGSTGFYASPAVYLEPLPPFSSGASIFTARLDAQEYIERLVRVDLEYRSIKEDRVQSSLQRIRATFYLAYGVCDSVTRNLWNQCPSSAIDESFPLSEDQQAAMDFFIKAVSISNAEEHFDRNSKRRLFISGEPGSGKSEVFVRYCAYGLKDQLRVLILCPTGQLVAAYRQRLPDSELLRVDTVHAALHIHREAESLVMHTTPMTLRQYDAILIDECSQFDNDLAEKLDYALDSLPQRPFIGAAADWQQVQPVHSNGFMRHWCDLQTTIKLRTIHRTDDNELLDFLRLCRTGQPERATLFQFFRGRRFRKSLADAVAYGSERAVATGRPFMWLCVTNAGVEHINRTVLDSLGLLDDCLKHGFPTDPNAGEVSRFYASPGLLVRLTRNLDKDRGFVNGAMGTVETILHQHGQTPVVFTVKLSMTGVMVLVHPVWHDRQMVLPCTYGYATTVRRAQGATYYHGCLYFDHRYPPDAGYGYVAASRFKSKAGVYLYGKVRRTDFIPVHSAADASNYQRRRSDESDTDYDSSEEESHAILYERHANRLSLGSDGELSDGYGSDSSLSYNEDDIAASHEATDNYFRNLERLGEGSSISDRFVNPFK